MVKIQKLRKYKIKLLKPKCRNNDFEKKTGALYKKISEHFQDKNLKTVNSRTNSTTEKNSRTFSGFPGFPGRVDTLKMFHACHQAKREIL